MFCSPHVHQEQDSERKCGERKCGQCRADEGDVGGHLIYYCMGGIRCTSTVQRKLSFAS